MQYESQIKRLLKIFETENQNYLDTFQKLQLINLVLRPEQTRKVVGVINLTVGYNVQTGTTTPDGKVNPLVTITMGAPQVPIPPPIFPVLMDFAVAGQAIVIPNAILEAVTSVLLVASGDTETPVPVTEDDVEDLSVTKSPNGVGSTPINGTPVFIAPGIVSIPLDDTETNVSGTNPYTTITVSNGQVSQQIQLMLQPAYVPPSSLAVLAGITYPANDGDSPVNDYTQLNGQITPNTGNILGTNNNVVPIDYNANAPIISLPVATPQIQINFSAPTPTFGV